MADPVFIFDRKKSLGGRRNDFLSWGWSDEAWIRVKTDNQDQAHEIFEVITSYTVPALNLFQGQRDWLHLLPECSNYKIESVSFLP